MISASVGTAILVTVMTTAAENAKERPEISYPDMHGANVAFMVISILSLLSLIFSFFIKKDRQSEGQGKQQRVVRVKTQE
jgi:Na+/melibiose symporter-like transporter